MYHFRTIIILIAVGAFVSMVACGSDDEPPSICADCCEDGVDLTAIPYTPTEKRVELPEEFPRLEVPQDNPLTEQGVELGRFLFYDPILSLDSTISCSSCHKQELAFTDGTAFSPGVGGTLGMRSSMSLLNVGLYYNGLFWDGRSENLEAQALLPVEDPVEMHESWPNVERKLMRHPDYPGMFREAFGIEKSCDITKELAAKAIAQFLRTIVSYNSLADRVGRKEVDQTGRPYTLSDSAVNGFIMFFDHNIDYPDAECGHCHTRPLFTSNNYFNNGIDSVEDYGNFFDRGLGGVSGSQFDNGKFRTPSLRNIAYTAPYMHDGRFQTLEEVLDHYNKGGHGFPNEDANIRPLGLTEQEKSDIIAYLRALSDTAVLSNPAYSNPFD